MDKALIIFKIIFRIAMIFLAKIKVKIMSLMTLNDLQFINFLTINFFIIV